MDSDSMNVNCLGVEADNHVAAVLNVGRQRLLGRNHAHVGIINIFHVQVFLEPLSIGVPVLKEE